MADVRFWDDVEEGAVLPTIEFPLTIHRFVVEAGGNRDFSTVHHNGEAAKATGAPDAFANNVFIQGMFERLVREFIGLRGIIRKIDPFRMRALLLVGTVARASGSVKRKWQGDAGEGYVEFVLNVEADGQVTASGLTTVILPMREA